MGSVIIKASHTGTIDRAGNRYPLPASDEEMEIARRAAEYTRKRWKAQREHEAPKPEPKKAEKPLAKRAGSKARKPKPAANADLRSAPSARNASALSRAEKPKAASSAPRESPQSAAARKLGISEVELRRRVAALTRWRAH